MDKKPLDFSGNIERFSGFADLYESVRPAPPAILADILTQLAQVQQPDLVVDLGSGTGLSTRYWADKAKNVVGVEPTPDMRRQAEVQTEAENVSYREGYSHATGLPDRCAEIVTCAQSLHWMEPQSTFEEAARILIPGGVFAAYDYDWPPTSHWQAEAAYRACMARIVEAERNLSTKSLPQRWEKQEHLARMHKSGSFRYTKEMVVHHTEWGNADRFIGLLLSQGSVMTLLKNGLREEELGIDVFRRRVLQALGRESKTWYWSSRIRYGIV